MRRWIGAAFAAIGLLTLALLFVSNPPPTPYEEWALQDADAGHLLVALGPALARYEPDADVTRAVFWCGHQRCPNATTLAGDQRGVVAERSVVLYFPVAPPPRATESMAPLATGEPQGNVTSATLARFEPGAAWFTLTLYEGAFVLMGAGVLVAAGASAQRLFVTLMGAGAGLVVGTFAAPLMAALILPLLLAFLVGAAALILAVSSRWWPRLAPFGAFFVGAFAALVFALLVVTRFFAHAPTL